MFEHTEINSLSFARLVEVTCGVGHIKVGIGETPMAMNIPNCVFTSLRVGSLSIPCNVSGLFFGLAKGEPNRRYTHVQWFTESSILR